MLQKPDNSPEIFLREAAAVPDVTDESFAFLPYPNIIKCSFGKLYFTTIIIQIKFLLAAVLAFYKPSGKGPLYNLLKGR